MSSSNTSTGVANQMSISKTNPMVSQGSSLHGPVAILWDIENCPVPSGVRPEDVAGNIRMALRAAHPVIDGAVTMFSAYGDFNAFPRRLREGCQRTGVKLVDVPNGRKDAADKAILVDMFLFALDNSPPSSIMLISGDVDFAHALHILGQRGYNVVLVIPSGTGVSSALSNAGRFVWDWPSVVRGEGFVHPSSKPNVPPPCAGPAEAQNEDDAPKSPYNTREVSIVSEDSISSILRPQNSTTSRSHSLPSGLNEVSTHNDLTWVQPGDVKGLKGQLVKLLESFCGNLPLTRLRAEYQKMYGRPLYVSEYGAVKLVNLLKKMVGAISVQGKGENKTVCLSCIKPEPPVILAKKGKKETSRAKKGTSRDFGQNKTVSRDSKILSPCSFKLQPPHSCVLPTLRRLRPRPRPSAVGRSYRERIRPLLPTPRKSDALIPVLEPSRRPLPPARRRRTKQ